MLKKFTVSLAFVLASANACASVVWKQGMTIAGLQSLPDGGFIVYGPQGTDPVCEEGGRLFYAQPNQTGQTLTGVKSAFALFLTAYTTGKTVTFTYDNATVKCFIGTVLLNPS